MSDIAELREKSTDELKERVADLDKKVFELRVTQGAGQSEAPNQMKVLRKERARVKTLLRERELASGGDG